MFRIIFTFTFLIINSSAFADTAFIINDPCSDKDILNAKISETNANLGDLVVKLLTNNKISFSGSRGGISSINNSATGDDALQIISNYEMLAFGWCYKIDNIVSEEMPDMIFINQSTKNVKWYYGFAHYLNGIWISQCEENKNIVRKYYCH